MKTTFFSSLTHQTPPTQKCFAFIFCLFIVYGFLWSREFSHLPTFHKLSTLKDFHLSTWGNWETLTNLQRENFTKNFSFSFHFLGGAAWRKNKRSHAAGEIFLFHKQHKNGFLKLLRKFIFLNDKFVTSFTLFWWWKTKKRRKTEKSFRDRKEIFCYFFSFWLKWVSGTVASK